MAHLLHDTYKDERKLEQYKKKALEDEEAIRKACEVLRYYRFKVATVEDVKSLNQHYIDTKVEESKQTYLKNMEGLFLSQESIDKTLAMMEEARVRGGEAADKVASILAEYEGVSFKMDSKGRIWFDRKQMEKHVTEKATCRVPAVLKGYYTKLGNVIDSLNELRQFEKDNNLLEFSTVGPYQNTPNIQAYFYDEKEDKFVFPVKEFIWLWQNNLIGPGENVEDLRKEFQKKWGGLSKT